jgi:hypothetical protein
LGEFFEWQHRRRNHVAQGIEEQIGIVAAIEPERHFFKVGLQVLRAEFVPATAQTTLEQGERGFNGIGVGLAAAGGTAFGFDL